LPDIEWITGNPLVRAGRYVGNGGKKEMHELAPLRASHLRIRGDPF
jgi:hypothetical protein